MNQFDPAAATAAYLAQMSPAAQARATAYTQGGHWLLLWGWLVSVLAAWLVIRSGLLTRVEATIARKKRRLVLTSFVVALLFLLLDWVIELPWDVYAHWWRERSYGLTSQPLSGYLIQQTVSNIIGSIILAIFLIALYALMRRAPGKWWVWGGGIAVLLFAFIIVIVPTFLEPMFNTFSPAPVGPIRNAVVALAERTGTPADKIYIYDGSRQSNRYTAHVTGIFGIARIEMSNVMFQKGADVAEVRAVLAHEMGHYVHYHLILVSLAFGMLTMAGLWLSHLSFVPAARVLGSNVVSIADPAGVPVLFAIFVTLALLATPITNTISRSIEANADAFSMENANEPDGMARALVKSAEYRAASPGALEEFLFYDHPSVRRRVRAAMDWKAKHLK